MKINLRCISTLVNPERCKFRESTAYELKVGQTVEDLLRKIDVSDHDVKIAFVNSRIVGFDTVLSDGDNVGLAPAVGRM
jgi:molybdopterin converting factor small subunit